MWSCNRRFFLLSAAALGGCGLTPIYGSNGVGSALLDNVEVDTPDSPNTYHLTRYLEERLGRSSAPQFGLGYSLSTSEQGLAVSSTQAITRYHVLGDLSFALRDLDTQEVVASGKVHAVAGYSATGSTVATRAAQTDAYKRLMVMLSDRVIERLILALAEAS